MGNLQMFRSLFCAFLDAAQEKDFAIPHDTVRTQLEAACFKSGGLKNTASWSRGIVRFPSGQESQDCTVVFLSCFPKDPGCRA